MYCRRARGENRVALHAELAGAAILRKSRLSRVRRNAVPRRRVSSLFHAERAVRITGGRFGGRTLAAPGDLAIRPTSDKVRQAVFNIIAHHDFDTGFTLEGARVIDLFAGTGAMGIEAVSRGARYCLFVDESAESRALLRTNAGRRRTVRACLPRPALSQEPDRTGACVAGRGRLAGAERAGSDGVRGG